jgi:CelD/BcsL family acetyltransferase involved in cellulose biosynthesis
MLLMPVSHGGFYELRASRVRNESPFSVTFAAGRRDSMASAEIASHVPRKRAQRSRDSPVRDHASPAGLQWQIVKGDDSLLDKLEAEWIEDAENWPCTYKFLRPQLVRAHLSIYSPDASVVLVTARREGRLVAVLPLVERTIGVRGRGLRWLRSAGNEAFPLFDVVSRNENPQELARDLWRVLGSTLDWDILQINDAPLDGVAGQMRTHAERDDARIHVHRPTQAPYLNLPAAETLDEVIAHIPSKSMRKHLRRDLKQLKELGEVRLVMSGWDGDHNRMAACYNTFVEMEQSSWKGAAGYSIMANHTARAFYERIFNDPELRHHIRVHVLTCNDDPVAASIELVSGTIIYGLRIAFNDAYRKYSPGHLLTLYQVYEFGRQGFLKLDLGAGSLEYKMAWTPSATPMGHHYFFNRGLRGRLAHDLMFQLWPMIRQRLDTSRADRISRRIQK